MSGHILLQDLPKETWHTIRWGGCTESQEADAFDRDAHATQTGHFQFQKRLIGWKYVTCRTQPHLEAMLGHVAMVRKIMCTRLQSGDPNCMCVEVEVSVGMEILTTIPLAQSEWQCFLLRLQETALIRCLQPARLYQTEWPRRPRNPFILQASTFHWNAPPPQGMLHPRVSLPSKRQFTH